MGSCTVVQDQGLAVNQLASSMSCMVIMSGKTLEPSRSNHQSNHHRPPQTTTDHHTQPTHNPHTNTQPPSHTHTHRRTTTTTPPPPHPHPQPQAQTGLRPFVFCVANIWQSSAGSPSGAGQRRSSAGCAHVGDTSSRRWLWPGSEDSTSGCAAGPPAGARAATERPHRAALCRRWPSSRFAASGELCARGRGLRHSGLRPGEERRRRRSPVALGGSGAGRSRRSFLALLDNPSRSPLQEERMRELAELASHRRWMPRGLGPPRLLLQPERRGGRGGEGGRRDWQSLFGVSVSN